MPRLLVLLHLMISVGVTGAAPRVRPNPATDLYHPTTVGTVWVYEDDGREVTFVLTKAEARPEGTLVTVRRVQGWKLVTDRTTLVSRAGICDLSGRIDEWVKPLWWFKRDAAGWTWDDQRSYPGAEFNFEVRTRAKVEVPAGRLDCASVVDWVDDGRDNPRQTRWYAPGVGLVCEESKSSSMVLKAFFPGR